MSFLHRLIRFPSRAPRPQHGHQAPRRSYRPGVEVLEDRTVPSTFGSTSGMLFNHGHEFTLTTLQDGRVLAAGGNIDVSIVNQTEIYNPATGAWTATASMNVARGGHTATLLPGGEVLVAGGYGISSAELYNPSTGTWTVTGSMATPRSGATAALLGNGKVLVAAGGVPGSGDTFGTASAELYNPTTGTWTATGSLNTARLSQAGVTLADGRVLVAGGMDRGVTFANFKSAEIYNPVSETWSSTGDMAIGRRGSFTLTLVPSGEVLVSGGGTNWTSIETNQAELYDPSVGAWTPTTPLPTTRAGYSATLLVDGKVLVAGGVDHPQDFGSGTYLSTALLFDPAAGTWTPTANAMAVPRASHGAVRLADGSVLIVGGYNGTTYHTTAETYGSQTVFGSTGGMLFNHGHEFTLTMLRDGRVLAAGGNDDTSSLNKAEIYNPATGVWTAAAPMNAARSGHTATLLPDGQVLVAGGYGLRTAELFNPATGTWTVTGSMGTPRSGATAALLASGKVLVAAGGVPGSGDTFGTATAELYDPATGTWSATGPLNTARLSQVGLTLADGRVMVAGGMDRGVTFANFASAEIYNPVSGTWSPTGNMAIGRRGSFTLTLLSNGKVLVAGGGTDWTSIETNKAELYDPSTGIWTPTTPLPSTRAGHSATLLVAGTVLVAGGVDHPQNFGSGTYLSTALVFDPVSENWMPATGVMVAPRAAHGAVRLAGGSVLIAGGYNGTNYLASAETCGSHTVLNASDLIFVDVNAFGGSGGIIRVDPATGAQTVISSRGMFADPVGLAFAADGTLLVTDGSALGGAVLQVNPATGAQVVVSSGGNFVGLGRIVVAANRDIFVTDLSAFGGTGAIFKVNPFTGVQTVLSTGGNFYNPNGLALGADGNLYVSDDHFSDADRVIRVNPGNGAQTVLDSATANDGFSGLAVAPDGDRFVTDTRIDGGDPGVIRYTNGNRMLYAGGNFVNPAYPAVESADSLLVADQNAASAVIRVNLATGAQTILSSGGNFVNAAGIAVLKAFDDSAPAFSTVGAWGLDGGGYGGLNHYAAGGTGSNQATWSTAATPGRYRVSATWVPASNRATDAPYTVLDGGTPLATVRVNQQQAATDFAEAGLGWKDLGTFNVSSGTLTVRLTDQANQFVIADAVRLERVGSLAPDIQVLDGVANVPANIGTVDLGMTFPAGPLTRTFTVTNTGGADLTLGAITVPSGFSLAAGFGTTTLAPGASTTFTVRLDAAAAGSYSGSVSFGTNVAAKNPFAFNVSGTVTTTEIVNDVGSGFTTAGTWGLDGGGYGGLNHYHGAGSGADQATWSFTTSPGRYRISATWVAAGNRATDAPYTLLDGASTLATARINQQLSPADFSDAGVGWKDMGTVNVLSGTLLVRLTDQANQFVIADAIRVERLSALVPDVQVLDGTTDLANGSASVNFGSAAAGLPVTRTFSVKNVGAANLTLGAITLPSGFSLAAGFGATTLAPGATTTFAVRLDGNTAGSFSGDISFGTNDPDENPFHFTAHGTAGAARIIDDADLEFATVGTWGLDGGGVGGLNHYHAAGTGASLATWTFAASPGRYRVWATWTPAGNRATNAPYTILDGSTSQGTVLLNQEQPPAGLNADGATWTQFGAFSIASGTLAVRLTDQANEFVIADAIRAERIGDL